MGASAATSGTSLVSVGKSALYVDGNSEFLVRTLSGAGTSRKTFTIGGWFYKTRVGSGSDCRIFQWDNGSTNIDRGMILIDNTSPDAIKLLIEDASDVATMIWTSTQLLRDQAWYHWCLTVDTTPATPIFKFFLNNEEITAWTKGTDTIAQDDVFTIVDSGARQAWGSAPEGSGYFDGYMAECFLLDGQVVTDATDFVDVSADGLFVTPKSNAAMKALTFGDEGFYLDNVTNAQTDASGNGNNFTNTNTVTLSTNTPTNMLATFNPLINLASASTDVLSNGNNTVSSNSNSYFTNAQTTLAFTSGKYIYAITPDAAAVDKGNGPLLTEARGNYPNDGNVPNWAGFICLGPTGSSAPAILMYERNPSGGATATTIKSSTTLATNDKLVMAVDADAGKVWMGWYDTSATSFEWLPATDGGTVGNPALGTNPTHTWTPTGNPLVFGWSAWGVSAAAIGTCTMDTDDLADFMTVPAGFKSLSTSGIAANTPTTASDVTKYFDTILYEGNGAGQRVGQFQPFGNAFTVAKSSTFVAANNEYLARTPGATGVEEKGTFSGWVKRGLLGFYYLFVARVSDSQLFQIYFAGTGELLCGHYSAGYDWNLTTTQDFVDTSQWYHIVVGIDTTQATASDRVKVYVNGVQQIWFNTETYPAEDFVNDFNTASVPNILGSYNDTPANLYDGYMSEVVWIDGTQYAASDFGQTDTTTNRWIPKDVSGLTFGTNGFYLDFADSDNVGDDESGNSNDFTNNNTVTQSGDSPTTNACVLNTYNASATAPVLSNGNRAGNAGGDSGSHRSVVGTLSMPANSGKYYWEMTSGGPSGVYQETTGIIGQNAPGYPTVPAYGHELGNTYTSSYGMQTNGKTLHEGVYVVGYATAYTAGVVIGVGYDSDNGILKYWRANSDLGNAFTGIDTSWNYAPAVSSMGSGTYTYAFAEADLTYSIPTGYQTLVQDNLPSSDKFVSAFSWIKNRDATDSHMLFDRLRGIKPNAYDWSSDLNAAQVGRVESVRRMLVGGVELGNFVGVNTANESYVLWNWMMEATGTGSSNTDGTINTTKTLVDTTLGMSISTYTGASVNGAGTTIGHGLGVAPEMIIVKNLSYAGSAAVYHSSIWTNASAPQVLYLSGTAAAANDTNVWGTSGAVTSSTFTVGDWQGTNYADQLFVAYCFAPSQFMSFGSYVGNANADGPFIPFLNSLGVPIQPRWTLIKAGDFARAWYLSDVKRNGNGNPIERYLLANENQAGADDTSPPDFVTGGAKIRGSSTGNNNSGTTYVYMAIGTPIIDTDGRIIAGR